MAKKLAEKLIKKVQLHLDGKDWQLVITHNTLIECEELTGLNLLTGEVNLARPSAKLMRALLYVSLQHAGAKYTLDQVGELIRPNNMGLVQEALLNAWFASMPEKEESDTANPTPAA